MNPKILEIRKRYFELTWIDLNKEWKGPCTAFFDFREAKEEDINPKFYAIRKKFKEKIWEA